MNITVEFLGGLKDLFNQQKSVEVSLPPNETEWTVGKLILWLRDNLLTAKPEMFVKDNSVRPGILVAVNEVDWELLETTNCALKEGDNVIFITTLHGG